MALAEPSDVEARWVFDAPLPEEELIAATLDDAHVLIGAEFPDLDERIADDDEATGTLAKRCKLVVCRMVLRYLQNPDGKSSSTIGSTATSYKVGRPGLFLDDDDRALLVDDGQDAAGADAFTINPTPATAGTLLDRLVVNSDDPPDGGA